MLRDPRWQRQRLEVMQAASFACQDCGSHSDSLNVHHSVYVRDRRPWEYEADFLLCLCDACHKRRHEVGDMALYQLGLVHGSERVEEFMQGLDGLAERVMIGGAI